MRTTLTSFLTLLALGATIIPAAASAQDVPYVQMSVCDPSPFKSLRDYWDQKNSFCYVRNGQKIEVPLSGLGEIKLRENGKSVAGEYYDALSTQNKDVVGQYKTYFVRYLAIDKAPSVTNRDFVVQVFFDWGFSTQTIYAFGQIAPDGTARLNGFANSQAVEGHYRAAYNTLTNLFAIFRAENPNRVGVNQTKAEDRERIAPAADVISHFQRKSVPIKDILKP